MKIIHGLHNLPYDWPPCAVMIGKFDGMHLGHQALVQMLTTVAAGLPKVLLTFYPHPARYFHPTEPFYSIYSKRQFWQLAADLNLDAIVYLRFDAKLRAVSPAEFLQLLLDKLRVRKIVIGDNFRYGYQGVGDALQLQQAACAHNVEVKIVKSVVATTQANVCVSSSRIRAYLAQNQFDQAAEYLGRRYALSGKVVRGDQLGRKLGFPTANICLAAIRPVLKGVYAVKVHGIYSDRAVNGVANIGWRPTVNGTQFCCEVHLLDFKQDIYGYRVALEFIGFIRAEQKFGSLDALVAQIKLDIKRACLFLKEY